MKYSILTAALLGTAITTPALATDITIRDFVGTVTIVDGNDGLDILRNGKQSVEYSENGDSIVIDGGLSRKERGEACNSGGWSWDLDFNGRETKGDSRLRDYPELRISVPNGSNLTLDDSYVALESTIRLGKADLSVGGCFDMEIDAAETMRLDKSGSGDIGIGEVVGTLNMEKSGSGDMEIGRLGGLDLEKSGSGDIDVDRINGMIMIEMSGSGDVDIKDVNVSMQVEKSGSGDLEVGGGEIDELDIQNSGSGDVDIDASVKDAKIRASGSGDVYVKSISDLLYEEVSGSADFNRGDD